jgi:hypothetical protein
MSGLLLDVNRETLERLATAIHIARCSKTPPLHGLASQRGCSLAGPLSYVVRACASELISRCSTEAGARTCNSVWPEALRMCPLSLAPCRCGCLPGTVVSLQSSGFLGGWWHQHVTPLCMCLRRQDQTEHACMSRASLVWLGAARSLRLGALRHR